MTVTTEPQSALVSVFMNRSNQAIRIPKDMSFTGVRTLQATRVGDVLTLRPAKPTWESFFDRWSGQGDDEFFDALAARPDVVESRPADLADEKP